MKKLKKTALIFAAAHLLFLTLLLVYFIVMSASIIKKEPPSGLGAVIVLGAGLRGEQVSITLAQRLDRALEYLEKNEDTIVVVSGGQGEGELITEALAMKRYLVSKGLNENRIFQEDKSVSTHENFKFSKLILDEKLTKGYTIGFSTNDFHCFRSLILAEKKGFEHVSVIAAPTLNYMLASYSIREYFALLWEHKFIYIIFTITTIVWATLRIKGRPYTS